LTKSFRNHRSLFESVSPNNNATRDGFYISEGGKGRNSNEMVDDELCYGSVSQFENHIQTADLLLMMNNNQN
jgi:hypothetical protein